MQGEGDVPRQAAVGDGERGGDRAGQVAPGGAGPGPAEQERQGDVGADRHAGGVGQPQGLLGRLDLAEQRVHLGEFAEHQAGQRRSGREVGGGVQAAAEGLGDPAPQHQHGRPAGAEQQQRPGPGAQVAAEPVTAVGQAPGPVQVAEPERGQHARVRQRGAEPWQRIGARGDLGEGLLDEPQALAGPALGRQDPRLGALVHGLRRAAAPGAGGPGQQNPGGGQVPGEEFDGRADPDQPGAALRTGDPAQGHLQHAARLLEETASPEEVDRP